MLCGDVFPKLTRQSDFLAHFPPRHVLGTGRCVIVQLGVRKQPRLLLLLVTCLFQNVLLGKVVFCVCVCVWREREIMLLYQDRTGHNVQMCADDGVIVCSDLHV